MFDIQPTGAGVELTNETVSVTLSNILDNGAHRWANVEIFKKEPRAELIPERRLDLLDAKAQNQLLATLTVADRDTNWDMVLTAITQAAKREGAGKAESEDSDSWEPPLPFQGNVNVPPFPSEVLPVTLRSFVLGLAEATQTPVDLAALLALAVCASAVARKVEICVRPGYTEPLNIFVAAVLPPGSRKSSVFANVLEPVEAFERDENIRLAPEIAKTETEFRLKEKALAQLEARAARETNSVEQMSLTRDAVRLAQELAVMKRIYPPRLVADDATTERLASLLCEQNGRLGVMTAEGADVFDLMAGRYSGNRRPNFGAFLRGHAGDTLRVDRVGRQSEFVQQPALTLAITVQPEALRGLISQPGFQGRGLLGRFLYAIPASMMGRRQTAPPPLSDDDRKTYHGLVTALLKTDYVRDDGGERVPHTLNLDASARDAIDDFDRRIEPQLGPFGSLGYMADWAGKLVGAAGRIAGVLHMVEYTHAGGKPPWEIAVSKSTMDAAIKLADYFIPHAKAAYGAMDADPLLADAKHLLDWIRSEKRGTFSKRDANQATKGRIKTVADLEPVLKLLADHDYIRLQDEENRSGPGRKPSPTFIVNPLCSEFSEFSEYPTGVNSENCENSEIKDSENFSGPETDCVEEEF